MRLKLFHHARTVFTYVSLSSEVSTDLLIKKFFGEKKIVVPIVSGREIHLKELKDGTLFRKGKFGIREPKKSLPYKKISEIDVALIPGIAFDESGRRIGFGGGYFDRLLAKLHCTTIGLAYEFQIVDKAPARSYDVPVDYIITEKRIIRCKQLREKSSKQKNR